ncbi:ABC transporter type 1, transmembrane domain containing protein [Lactarius tabidus]
MGRFQPRPRSARSLARTPAALNGHRTSARLVVVSLSIPFRVRKLIDCPGPTSAYPMILCNFSLTQATAGIPLVFTIGGACNAAAPFSWAWLQIVTRLREQTNAATVWQEVEFLERGEGNTLSRLSVDISVVGESVLHCLHCLTTQSVTQNLSDGLRAVVMSFAGLGAMLYISLHLTFLMLAIVPPISLGAVFYGRYLKKLSNKTQEALGDMTKVAQEALAAHRTVQLFNAIPHEEKKFSDRVDHVLKLVRHEAVASGFIFGSNGWIGNVALSALLSYGTCFSSFSTRKGHYTEWIGGSLVGHRQISVEKLTSHLIKSRSGSPFSPFYIDLTSIMRGIGDGTRIFELLDRAPAIRPGVGVALDPKRTGPLRFEKIMSSYPTRSEVNVLEDFYLEVKVGENVAVV